MERCPICKKEQTKLVRVSEETSGETQNTTEICENEKCSLFFGIEKIKNWILRNRPEWKRKSNEKEKF